jgi:hypothetical protein
MKYYGFGFSPRDDDEFWKSGDIQQGHATPVKKRHKRKYKVSARQATKKMLRKIIQNLKTEII